MFVWGGRLSGKVRLVLPQLPSHRDQPLISASPHLQPLQHLASILFMLAHRFGATHGTACPTWRISHGTTSFWSVIHLCRYKPIHTLYCVQVLVKFTEINLDAFFTDGLPVFFEGKPLRKLRRQAYGNQALSDLKILVSKSECGEEGGMVSREISSSHCSSHSIKLNMFPQVFH